MNKRAMSVIFAAVGTIGTTAVAQVAPETSARSENRPLSAGLTTQALMQNNGGSLYQATSYGTPAPGTDTTDPAAVQKGTAYGVPVPPPHVLKKHDLINIVVREESESATTGDSQQQRAVDFDAKVDAAVRLSLSHLELRGGAEGSNPPELKLEGSRDFKGQGTYDRSDTLVLRMEGEVVDVKPNGTLVIQASKKVGYDEEQLLVTLTGTCRVQDVDATNSVLSTDMHNLNLQKEASGQVRDTTRRGFIHRLLDLFNPF